MKDCEEKTACRCGGKKQKKAPAKPSCCGTPSSAKHEPCEGGLECCGVSKSGFNLSDKTRIIISALALVAGFCISHFEIDFPFFPWSDPAWIAVILCGFPIFKSAYQSLVHDKCVTSALLISIAMIATVSLQLLMTFTGVSDGHFHDSYIFAAGEIAFLMALGEAIEERTIAKTREGIERLVKLAPSMAFKKVGYDYLQVNVSEIRPNDLVLIRPNDMISVDGQVVDGGGSVDQSGMTGESVPVEKSVGDSVLAGTWNKSGSMVVRVLKEAKDSAVSKLITLVEEAEGKKAPIARIANKWASRIVPAAIVSSVLVFAFARFFLGTDSISALVRGVTILVVFCPCAFALATPTAIAAGIGNAARRGILIKSGAALEEFSRVDTVVFDKTGTLTTAALKVEAVNPVNLSEEEFLRTLASAELHSEHPIAKAVIAYAQKYVELSEPKGTCSFAGVGVECEIGGRKVLVSSFSALKKSGVDFSAAKNFIESHLAMGETIVCLRINGTFAGALSLSDEVRPGAAEAVSSLKKAGLRTAVLTGDNELAARRISQKVGVGEFYSSLLPAQKAEKILELKKSGANVCMIGDGVNDAPALANANCSIAMGVLGSDLAVETADAAFLNDNIALTAGFLRFAKAVIFTIRTNISLSLAISFAAIIFSAYGFLTPVSGALVHNLSSVIVVLNSASLLGRKKDYKN